MGDGAKHVAIGKKISQTSISYENNEYLQFIRDQMVDLQVRIKFIEQALDAIKDANLRRGSGPSWLQIVNLFLAVATIIALVYFANSFYAIAQVLHK